MAFYQANVLVKLDQDDIQVNLFSKHTKRRNIMLWTIIVILIILWLLGFLGGNISPSFPKTGSWIHVLVVIAVILILLKLLGIVNL
jgi:fatty acid desaturase